MQLGASSSASSTEGDSGLSVRRALRRGGRGGQPRRGRAGALAVVAVSVLAAGLLALAPAAQARGQANPSLEVSFASSGVISVTLPDGTPVGTASGAPTVIPAGFYTVVLSGPGGCTELPYFALDGPGVQIFDNMDLGEVMATDNADLLPNSTYTWRDDGVNPAVVYTFVTSATVEGAPPAPAGTGAPATPAGTRITTSSQDLVGSAILHARGTLVATVGASGRLSLTYRGRGLRSLASGRYVVTVTGKSARSGFLLGNARHDAVNVSGAAFVGKHSFSVDLSAGQWFYSQGRSSEKTYFIVVA